MTSPCPVPEEFSQLVDGELTENRAGQLRAHAAGCHGCGAALRAQQRLVARLRAPLPGVPSGGAVAAVMARLGEAGALPAAPEVRRSGRRAWAAGLAAAAAAVVVLTAGLTARDDGAFASRGPAVAWTSKVGVELWALQGQPRRLQAGDLLPPGVALVASYSNVDPAAGWLLAYAVDQAGEVHWLYPAYLDAATDPVAVRLEGSTVQRALGESVVLQDVPEGELQLVTVVSRTPHRVSEVEGAGPAGRTAEALRRRWPDARVDAMILRQGAAQPAGH